jgi:hypothetical protein
MTEHTNIIDEVKTAAEKEGITREELVELLRLETIVAKYKLGATFRANFYNFLTEIGFSGDEALKAVKYIWEES